MPRKIPKDLFSADSEPLWRDGTRFVAEPLRVRPCRKKTGHTRGGPATHKGSKCPNCRKQLILLWSLDLSDPLLPDYVRNGFSPAVRLPFYFCWQCMAASYSVSSDSQIRCFPFDSSDDRLEEDETPFGEEAPREAPLQPIELERLPTTIDALLTLSGDIGYSHLDEPAQRTLRKYYGQKIDWHPDLAISQVGGLPLIYQGRRDIPCPNKKCPASKLEHPYGEFVRPYLMKDLAVVHYADDPYLEQVYFQFAYVICRVCFSLRAYYRCT